MFCRNCGKQLPENNQFCPYCLTKYETFQINEPPKVDFKYKKEYVSNSTKNEDVEKKVDEYINKIDKMNNNNSSDQKYFKGYDPTYGCGYSTTENNTNNTETIYSKNIKNDEKDIFCFKCGKKIKSNTVFCSYCGTKQNNDFSTYSSDNQKKEHGSNNIKKLVSLLTILIIAFVILLPFHYVIGYGDFGIIIFAKENLSFSNTFITGGTVNKLIDRYNNSTLLEKFSIREESLFKKLLAEGIIYIKNDSENNF